MLGSFAVLRQQKLQALGELVELGAGAGRAIRWCGVKEGFEVETVALDDRVGSLSR